MIQKKRHYHGLSRLQTFEERYKYLRLNGVVGRSTYGFDRYLNQKFYTSTEWRRVRNFVILRDGGCDLGVAGREIRDKIIVHHMNPMSVEDIEHGDEDILNPDYLIATSLNTHNAIHFGTSSIAPSLPKERLPGDTKLW